LRIIILPGQPAVLFVAGVLLAAFRPRVFPLAILPQPHWKNNETRLFIPVQGAFDRTGPYVVHGAGF
jgi:hypothetical protein